MTSDHDDELAALAREIADKSKYVHDRTVLIAVLEHDGHDVSDYRKELANERSQLATRIARQFRLLEITSVSEGDDPASLSQE
ncbi:hypothetical protein IVB41_25525 [Bradyrhizobium sp. 44]|jgi:hypothetical protein|uniref:hypothetical protein n=1 Tax=unclassified Bradyrhizobium TaxID=2631580 RepID=UPI00048300BF|nr:MULTISPECIES: hypothetical protein [unclassified Bradyrhizobium]MCK1287271.1 hypothetical protein [Bradyrhizobium sp. 44]